MYTFGDSALATRRLDVLADSFDRSSADFLSEYGLRGINLAVDLGCGIGRTTDLVAAASEARLVVGLDTSDSFLCRAREGRTNIRFLEHNVTATPFPVGPADLVYCRFLLTHMHSPGMVVRSWLDQLALGGRLLLDEVEEVEVSGALLKDYQAAVNALLKQHGQQLHVGPLLNAVSSSLPAETLCSRTVTVRPTPRQAAEMFYLNTRSWGREPVLNDIFGVEHMRTLVRGLGELVRSGVGARASWQIRQIALRRG